ncbi:transposase [Stutzerimonas stutzeri]
MHTLAGFDSPRQLLAFLGLVPSERSSGRELLLMPAGSTS